MPVRPPVCIRGPNPRMCCVCEVVTEHVVKTSVHACSIYVSRALCVTFNVCCALCAYQVERAAKLHETCAALLHSAADTAVQSDTHSSEQGSLRPEAVTAALQHVDKLRQLAAAVGVDAEGLAQTRQQIASDNLPRNPEQRQQHVAKVSPLRPTSVGYS